VTNQPVYLKVIDQSTTPVKSWAIVLALLCQSWLCEVSINSNALKMASKTPNLPRWSKVDEFQIEDKARKAQHQHSIDSAT